MTEPAKSYERQMYEERLKQQDNIAWETTALGRNDIWFVERKPTRLELAIGIFVEQVDILLRDAVVHYAEKGYIPFDSCQGHHQDSYAHISFKVIFPPEVRSFFEKEGVKISKSRTQSTINLDHKGLSPVQLKERMTDIAMRAPTIGELRWMDDPLGETFRDIIGKGMEIPAEDNPVWYREYPKFDTVETSPQKIYENSMRERTLLGKLLKKIRQLL